MVECAVQNKNSRRDSQRIGMRNLYGYAMVTPVQDPCAGPFQASPDQESEVSKTSRQGMVCWTIPCSQTLNRRYCTSARNESWECRRLSHATWNRLAQWPRSFQSQISKRSSWPIGSQLEGWKAFRQPPQLYHAVCSTTSTSQSRVCNGASSRPGAQTWTVSQTGRVCPSQERQSEGQPTPKSHADDQAATFEDSFRCR